MQPKISYHVYMSLISIIVPIHNTASFLSSCVKSIQNQTLSDIEIILVENASTDNSLEICHEFQKEDDRIKVVHIDKNDPSTARIAGLNVASSDFIGFIDSDDTIQPDMFEDLYNIAVKHDLNLVISNFVFKYLDRKDRYPYNEDGTLRILSAKELTTLNFEEKIPRVLCTMLFRKSLFEQVKMPMDMFYEDRASTFQFMAHCVRGGVLNKSYYNYFQRPCSISHTKDYIHYRDHVKSDFMRLKFIQDSGFYSESEKSIVASKSANLYLSKLRHMIAEAGSAKEKIETLNYCRKINLIPEGTRLTLKAFLIKTYIKNFILNRIP